MVSTPDRLPAVSPPAGRIGAAAGPGIVLELRRDVAVWRLCEPREPDGFHAAAEGQGRTLPREPNTVSAWDGAVALWVAPGEWFVVAEGDAVAADDLRALLAGPSGAVTDLSHARTVARISGARADELIAKGCPLDLDPARFPPGQCAQSVMSGVNVLLHKLDDRPSYDLYVMRSHAQHLWEWLLAAGAEFGIEIAP
ncbi:MAG: sarcosine oxidase subunit gamma [Alphaproteobacteria bacterium]